jgi:amino acid transporter
VRAPERTLPYAYYGSILTAIVLYAAIVIVTLGHLSFDALSRVQNFSLSAAAEAFMGRIGFVLLAIGAMLATASAINADLFGASKLPIMLAEAGEAPERYGREVWGRHPAGLVMIATFALVVVNLMNLHAIAAASSAGFLLVFAMVSVGNARLSRETRSKAWLCCVAALACFTALGTMVYQIGRNPKHRHELIVIAGLTVLPFAYQVCYRALRRNLLRTPEL